MRGERRAVEELVAHLGPAIQALVARASWKCRGAGLPVRQDVSEPTEDVFSELFAGGGRLLLEWGKERGPSLRTFAGLVASRHVMAETKRRRRGDQDEPPLGSELADSEQELLDRYALGELLPAERRELERRAASSRDFASRLELYRPLDTYERKVLADRVVRAVAASKTKRRPALLALGALSSAAVGVGLLLLGAARDDGLPAFAAEVEHTTERAQAPSRAPEVLRVTLGLPLAFVLRPSRPYTGEVDARVFVGADPASLRPHDARVERLQSGSLRAVVAPLPRTQSRGVLAVVVFDPARGAAPAAFLPTERGTAQLRFDFELR